jgi:hypothetical protein
MQRRLWLSIGIIVLIAAGLAPALTASGQGSAPSDPLLRLLHFVPDTPEARQWVVYGDEAAWLQSWGVPRVDNVDQLDALDRDPHTYWMFIMPYQTVPPQVLGVNTFLGENQRDYYGFDLFNADRFLEAGLPPQTISVIESSAEKQQIANTLIATGYQAQELDGGGTLYSILEDNQMALGQNVALPRVGMTGGLNRIIVLDGQLIVGRATNVVESSLQAQQGAIPSLAEDAVYTAAAQALDDESLSATGDLVGAIMIPQDAIAADIEALRQSLIAQFGPEALPPFDLVTFATRHAPGATYLILDVVFPAGTDAAAAADVLSNRLQNYVSLATGQPFAERWTFDRATSIEIDGLPVALVVMRVDDPPVAAEGEQANSAVFNWITVIERRDLGFLLTGSLAQ